MLRCLTLTLALALASGPSGIAEAKQKSTTHKTAKPHKGKPAKTKKVKAPKPHHQTPQR
jgi:hypothetical protein